MVISKRCISLSLFLALAIPVVSMAATTIKPGYYVGPGDGSTVVFRVLPGGEKAVLGAFNAYTGMGFKPGPITPKRVKEAASQGNAVGTLQPAGEGRFIFTIPKSKYQGTCISNIIVKKDGVELGNDHPLASCNSYHGASWGYGHGEKHLLKPYPVN